MMSRQDLDRIEAIATAVVDDHLPWESHLLSAMWQSCVDAIAECVATAAPWPWTGSSMDGLPVPLGAIDRNGNLALESIAVVGVITVSYAKLARLKEQPPTCERIERVVRDACDTVQVAAHVRRLLVRHLPRLFAGQCGTEVSTSEEPPLALGVWVESWRNEKHAKRSCVPKEEADALINEHSYDITVDEIQSYIFFGGKKEPIHFADVPRMILSVLWLVLRNFGGSFTRDDVDGERRNAAPVGDDTIYKHVSSLRTFLNEMSSTKLGTRLLKHGKGREYWVSKCVSVLWLCHDRDPEKSRLRYAEHRPFE